MTPRDRIHNKISEEMVIGVLLEINVPTLTPKAVHISAISYIFN